MQVSTSERLNERAGGRIQWMAMIGLIVLVFTAGWLSEQGPARYVFVVFIGVASAALAVQRRSLLPLAAAPLAIAAAVFFVAFPDADAALNDRIFRLLVLYPSMFVVGIFWLNTQNNRRRFATAYLWVAVLISPLAVFEHTIGRSVFDRAIPANLQFAQMRAFLLTEHTLVLATLLLLAVPMALAVQRWTWRIMLVATLGAGIWATESDGCLAIFCVLLGVELIVRITKSDERARSAMYRVLLFAFAAALLLPGLSSGGSAIVTSGISDVASFEYRYALYSVLPNTLQIAPLGWGVSGLPAGVFVTPSQFGTLDLSRTVDSELMYSAIDFGWIGLLAFLTAAWFVTSRVIVRDPAGRMTTVLTACGMFLALHAWTGLGSLWFLLLGGCAAALGDRAGSPTHPPSIAGKWVTESPTGLGADRYLRRR